MALNFDGQTFTGGHYGQRVEQLVAHVIGEELQSSAPPCAKRVHDLALRELRRAGLCPVSYGAVRRRMAAVQAWLDRRRSGRMVFSRELPVEIMVLGDDGAPVGRPLITLSGMVTIEGGRAQLDARVEVSFPERARRAPMTAILPVPRRFGRADLANFYSQSPDGRVLARGRDEGRRRERTLRDADRIMDYFREPGASATFGYLASVLGSRRAAAAAVQHLIDVGTLRTSDRRLRDDSVIELSADDAF